MKVVAGLVVALLAYIVTSFLAGPLLGVAAALIAGILTGIDKQPGRIVVGAIGCAVAVFGGLVIIGAFANAPSWIHSAAKLPEAGQIITFASATTGCDGLGKCRNFPKSLAVRIVKWDGPLDSEHHVCVTDAHVTGDTCIWIWDKAILPP